MTPDPRAQAADRLECPTTDTGWVEPLPGSLKARLRRGKRAGRAAALAATPEPAADAIREAVAVLRDPGCVGRGVEQVRGDGA